MQYFCGMRCFEHRFRFDPSTFVHFRKRIGEDGFSKIFAYSIQLHREEGTVEKNPRHLSDTTVQENNTTFPTDSKLCKKVIYKCNKISQKESITLRRSYVRESRPCLRETCSGKHPKRAKKAKRARKRLQTIANVQLRDLERKMTEEQKKSTNRI
jgi:IS5 family transposase